MLDSAQALFPEAFAAAVAAAAQRRAAPPPLSGIWRRGPVCKYGVPFSRPLSQQVRGVWVHGRARGRVVGGSEYCDRT